MYVYQHRMACSFSPSVSFPDKMIQEGLTLLTTNNACEFGKRGFCIKKKVLHSYCCQFPSAALNWICFGTTYSSSYSQERKQKRLLQSTKMKEKNNNKNFANLINHKVSQGAWGRREQRENITGNKEAWPSVLGNLHLHLSYLCLLAHRAFGFCDNYFSFTEEGYQPSAQPPTWRTSEITLRLAPTFRPVGHGCPCQEYKTPANIALGATGSRKPPHHDNPNRGFVLGNKT